MEFERFRDYWERYRRIPCWREFVFDMAFVPLLVSGFYGEDFFLLESANTRKEFSRFTYLGVPSDVRVVEGTDPFSLVKEAVAPSAPEVPELGDFCGGLVFMLGYGASNYTGVLRRRVREGEDLAVLMRADRFYVLDNYTQKVYGCVVVERGNSARGDYERAMDELALMEERLREAAVAEGMHGHKVEEVVWEMEPGQFMDAVAAVKEMIASGEAIQVVLSQKVEVRGNLNPVAFYRYLRKINPSPYMFFLKCKDTVYCGSSPEVHLRVKGKRALMKPIAGTYPVGPDLDRIIASLKRDEKERAEHLMLVDLARNDLYTHCLPESVEVVRFMEAEVYSHVVHLVSTVVGTLPPGTSPVDLLRMTFPAGTVSGAPKVRAMEIIDEMEFSPRDFYAGCVGYYSYNGNMDTCITIRSARFNPAGCVLRAGAGIVYDSVPEREHQEVVNKLKALLVAMENSALMEV